MQPVQQHAATMDSFTHEAMAAIMVDAHTKQLPHIRPNQLHCVQLAHTFRVANAGPDSDPYSPAHSLF
jgi:hypothetical protein